MEKAVLLKAIIDHAIDGLITIDEYGTIESINPAACKLFDYSEIEILGKNISLLITNSEGVKYAGYVSQYLNTGNKNILGKIRELIGVKNYFCWFYSRSNKRKAS